MRTKLVLGSLLGAVAIHGAFLACGMPAMHGDGGPLTAAMIAMRDAAVDALGLEVGDARAQDASACSCPVPPAPPETTFSLRVDRGSGPEEPMADYSTAGVAATPGPLSDGTFGVVITASATFLMPDKKYLSIDCSIRTHVDRSVVPGASRCTVSGANPSGVQSVSVTSLTNTALEIHIPSYSAEIPAQGGVTLTNIIFRADDPSAHFITPTHAYRP